MDVDSRPPRNPYLEDYRGRPLKLTPNSTKMVGADLDKASAWRSEGPTEQGFLILPHLAKDHVRGKAPPSIAAHRGQLWVVWADFDDEIYYAATTPESHGEEFGPRSHFPYPPPQGSPGDDVESASTGKGGLPAIANLNGVLHAVIVSAATGKMVHYIYDSEEQLAWVPQEGLPEECVAGEKTRDPAVVAFHNKLFLAYLGPDGGLFHAVFDIHSQTWSAPSAVHPPGAPPALVDPSSGFQGAPAMFVLNGALHLLVESAADNAEIVGYRYDYTESGWTWSPTDDVSEGKAARGVSAASYGGHAYLGFVENDGVFVAAHEDGNEWKTAEHVGGSDVKARFPPQIAVLNGRVHCVFAGKWKGDIHWFSRSVLEYDLKTWMGAISDETWLSAMTVPGTHDSCARSNVPFVRTQYLSIMQQLALGIRFFDLRLRRHDDGKLYCYHGGMPIGLPKGLSFDDVMEQVWAFIGPKDGKEATETVLISINNDNKSEDQKNKPQIFYNAVQEAIESTPTYENGAKRWYSEPVTAKLGDVRGKAVLLRRFAGDSSIEPTKRIGLDLELWLDDNPNFKIVTPTGVKVHLQDKWKYADRCELKELVSSKQGFVRDMLERAFGLRSDAEEEDTDPETTWYLNFCSAVGDPAEHGEVAEAKWIAVGAHSDFHFFGNWVEGMNVQTRDYLRGLGAGKRRLGVVNLDYPELPEDSDLVARLIETNF